jgi:pyruvate dehydrogenase E1 component alpha subunit
LRADEDNPAAPAVAGMTRDEWLLAYERMLLIRRFEERVGQLFAMGQLTGFCHLSIGREAVIAGAAMAAEPRDLVITTHRCHGHILAQGAPPGDVMAELLGRASGVCGGKGGSAHLIAPGVRFYGGHGIVGAPVALAAGLAFAAQYRGEGGVCLCTYGEGAADQGQTFEAYHLAARRKLPVIFIIDNDTGEAEEEAQALAKRGAMFAIPGRRVDGIDVAAVRAEVAAAVARARAGGGPTILEMLTYPYRGHANPTAGNTGGRQRGPEEVDPIAHARHHLLTHGYADEAAIKTIDREQRAVVREAVTFAQNAPPPALSDLLRDTVAVS